LLGSVSFRHQIISFPKTPSFQVRDFRLISTWLSVEIFGCAEGVHHQAGEDGMPVMEICRKAGISQATRSQPKNVAHATDAKLLNRARQRLVRLAKSTASP
jgi:hypothetical protein